VGLAAALLAAVAVATAPPPGAPIPRDPGPLAARVASTERSLDAAIDAWRASGTARPPDDVTLWALYEQRLMIVLTERARLGDSVLRRLPNGLAKSLRNELLARRELARLSTPRPRSVFRTGPAEPAAALRGYYDEAQRRFHVAWYVLAAVNSVESAFNKLRNASTAGAQGPMQFIPSTWKAYGLGGNVHDPRDAIMGAANYLSASGAPTDYPGAVYHYNPSHAYVRAVLLYARRMMRDPLAYWSYYNWQVFVASTSGDRRLTGPGL
jgi:soluble lytic murein transglycosylase-like protein